MAIKTKEAKETKDLESKTIIASATDNMSEDDTVAYGESLKFTDTEQVGIISDIENHIASVKAQRQSINIESEWKDCIDLYEGTIEDKTFPYEGSHNLHVHITSMVCDILSEKIKKNQFVKPMMLAQSKPGMTNYPEFAIQKKEGYINDKFYSEMNGEDKLSLIIDDAIKLGTGICKIKHVRESAINRVLEVYEPTIEDKARFIDDFSDEKDTKVYKENLKLLDKKIKEGDTEPLSIWVEKEEIIKFQPEIEWVDPLNLYIDCYIKDLRYHRIIAEKIHEKNWQELVAFFESGFFDKSSEVLLEDIKKKYGLNDEYKKKKYTLWECNVRNLKYKNKDINAIVTYIEEMPTRLAKAISFPYITNKANYVIYKIMEKRNSIYGTGLPTRLKATNIAINEFWNLQLDSAEFTIAPMMIGNISSPDFDPSTKKFGPAVVWWLGPNDKIEPFQNNKNLSESYRLLEYLHRYAEWITGVSAYMAGQAAPMDPRAPASKAYMLLQESNLRILSYIRRVNDSNVGLFEQIDQLYFQYYNDSVKFYKKSEDSGYVDENISRKELGTPVSWVPQLSDITINKALEKEENFKMAAFLQSQPMVMKLPEAQRKIVEIILRAQGGIWAKSISNFLPDTKQTDIVSQIMQVMTKIGPQGVMDLMAALMQGAKPPNQMTGPGAKMPPAPVEAEVSQPMNTMQGNIPRAE